MIDIGVPFPAIVFLRMDCRSSDIMFLCLSSRTTILPYQIHVVEKTDEPRGDGSDVIT